MIPDSGSIGKKWLYVKEMGEKEKGKGVGGHTGICKEYEVEHERKET